MGSNLGSRTRKERREVEGERRERIGRIERAGCFDHSDLWRIRKL